MYIFCVRFHYYGEVCGLSYTKRDINREKNISNEYITDGGCI